ncbi:MAG TPA: aminoglycoside adenylyltransferase family protein [Candidatus Limnocylindrales bacterium]|nr:aminoglycoside adenylyltransferase family protein [Candidatus Limnocylindrales bacterium]
MSATVGTGDRAQLEAAVAVVLAVLGDEVLGAYLYGSAVAGGLRHRSDLDLLCVSSRPTSHEEKGRLIGGLMPMSGGRAAAGPARSLEVTVVEQAAIRPWRYPPPLDFQYGDWFRAEYERGDASPWVSPNPDVAVLLTTALRANERLLGPDLGELVDPVPRDDLRRAMLDGIPDLIADLHDDTANVLLTLARIWRTLATGEISPKDAAADWAIRRLPEDEGAGLARARDVYTGDATDAWDDLRAAADADARSMVVAARALAATTAPRRARYGDTLS